ncbi:hypothetical protein [Limnobacter sp.]|uniref:hypothetical protein n=1 Tax=Limnobacter sp. TaxID=2003368 RepID=UPI002FE0449D
MVELNDLLAQVWPLAASNNTPRTETVNLNAALGCVVACDVFSQLNVPQHDNSGMDGYAVRCADIVQGVQFAVSQRVPAGASGRRARTR